MTASVSARLSIVLCMLIVDAAPAAGASTPDVSLAGYAVSDVEVSSVKVELSQGLGSSARLAPFLQCISGKHSRFYAQSAWLNLAPGQEADSWGEWENIGCDTWGANLRLGTANPTPGQDQSSIMGGATGCPTATNWASCNRVVPSFTPVAFGQIVRFTFRIRAPSTRGTYQLYMRPLLEADQWLEDDGVYWEYNTRLYNRTAAVNYADTYTSNTDAGDPKIRNSAYPDFPNDCQNYASQVLYAGGLPETLNQRFDACYYTDWFRPTDCFICNQYHFRWTHSWSVADCQRQFFSYYSDYFALVFWSVPELQPGDILHMDLEGVFYPTHARVMVGAGTDLVTLESWSNLFNQHTNDRKRRRWIDGLPADTALWKWHVTY